MKKMFLVCFLAVAAVAPASPTNPKDPDYYNIDAGLRYWYAQTFGKMPDGELWVIRAEPTQYIIEAWRVPGYSAPSLAALKLLTGGVDLPAWLAHKDVEQAASKSADTPDVKALIEAGVVTKAQYIAAYTNANKTAVLITP